MSDFCYLRIAGEREREGNLAEAMKAMVEAARTVDDSAYVRIVTANAKRILAKAAHRSARLLAGSMPTPIHTFNDTPDNYGRFAKGMQGRLPPLIALTTISRRVSRVASTIDSILAQTVRAHSINLYVSAEPYLVDEGIAPDDKVLCEIANMGVNIYLTTNIGPYRKQIPIVLQLRRGNAPSATPIITIDDDVIYPTNIIGDLLDALERSSAIVAHRGRKITVRNARLARYDTFDEPTPKASLSNLGTGKNGIAYRLSHFPRNAEDFVGPVLAPTADDLWCKWVTGTYCVPTFVLEPRAAYDSAFDFKESAPTDKTGLFHSYNARGMNDTAIDNLEAYFSGRRKSLASLIAGSAK